MNYKYQHAGIAGKFRLLHKAHVELILRAVGYTQTLHVFIVDVPEYKRYATIEQLQTCFHTIFAELENTNYELHIINEELSGRAWDERLLELVPKLEAMFDSKEPYDNVLLNNEFIELALSREISVSNIEQDMYQVTNYALIAEPFKQYVTKRIEVQFEKQFEVDDLFARIQMYYNAGRQEQPKVLFTRSDVTNVDQQVDQQVDHILYLQQNSDNNVSLPARAIPLNLQTREDAFGLLVSTIDTLLRADTEQIERTK